jgi:ABC-2 type transport system ATP-binding protein
VLDAAGITLESISLSRPTLDDVFLTMTGRSLRDDSPDGTRHAAEPEAAAGLPAAGLPAASDASAATASKE